MISSTEALHYAHGVWHAIQKLSAHLDVPQNYMFIGCPGDRFPHNLADLGGVRLIV